MDTLELLERAATRAEELAIVNDGQSEEYFTALGLPDEELVHEFITHQCYEIFKIRMFTGGGVSIENCASVSMMFGLVLGYQLALIRMEEEE